MLHLIGFMPFSPLHSCFRSKVGTNGDQLLQGKLCRRAAGPAAVSDPASFVYKNQSHVLYRDALGTIWDSWWDGNTWQLQQINLGGVTSGPAAIGDLSAFIYNNQSHVLYRDGSDRVWDSFYS